LRAIMPARERMVSTAPGRQSDFQHAESSRPPCAGRNRLVSAFNWRSPDNLWHGTGRGSHLNRPKCCHGHRAGYVHCDARIHTHVDEHRVVGAHCYKNEIFGSNSAGAGLLAVGIIAFGHSVSVEPTPALLYAPLPLLKWAAVRFGLAGVSWALMVVAILSSFAAIRGWGPFANRHRCAAASAFSGRHFRAADVPGGYGAGAARGSMARSLQHRYTPPHSARWAQF